MTKMQEYVSGLHDKAMESWMLGEDNNEIYVPVIRKETGHAVFIEVNTAEQSKKIKIFIKEGDASKYKASKEKYKVLLVKTKVKTLMEQMVKYISPNALKLDCVICTYDVEDELYELYVLWTNFNN
jgi:hypothetical protein